MKRWAIAVLLIAGSARAEVLTLDEAVRTAVRVHPSLQAADAQRDAAVARVGEQYASYLPSLNFNGLGRADYASFQVIVPGGAQTANPMQQTTFSGSGRYSGTLSIQQTLYDFGRTGWQVDAARRSAESSGADRDTARATVELNVVNAYYAVLQSIELEKVAEDALSQAQQHLAQANALFKVGTRPEIDVASAESLVASAKLQLVHARNAIAINKVVLNAAIGIVRDTNYDVAAVDQPPIADESAPIDTLVLDALKARPEYASLRLQEAAAEANVKAAHANYYPIFGASGAAIASGTDSAPGPFLDFYAQLTVTQPIFNGFITRHTVEENEALARAVRANLEALGQTVRTNVATAALGVKEAAEAVEAADAVEKQAEKQLAMATGRYQNGVGNIIELVDAQAGAVTARQQRVQAQYALATSRAMLARALGRTIVSREVVK